jgi:hypothetical protein
MVTLDNIVQAVPTFNGDLDAQQRDYERARQQLDRIADAIESFELAVKKATGFNKLNLPGEKAKKIFSLGDVAIEVTSWNAVPRPQYKEVVEDFEGWLYGINQLVVSGRTITGVAKRESGGIPYIETVKLRDDFDTIMEKRFLPDVKHELFLAATGDTADQLNRMAEARFELPEYPGLINQGNASKYALMKAIQTSLGEFVEAYEAALKERTERKKEAVVEVSPGVGYTVKKKTAKGPSWATIVKTLMIVKTDKKSIGEINTLADPSVSFERKQELPYDLWNRDFDNTVRLYVSIPSVCTRIDELKEGKPIVAKRTSYARTDIV